MKNFRYNAGRHRKGGCLVWIVGAFLIIAALLLTGCGDPPTAGYIYKMPYEGESYYWTSVCGAYNTNGTCVANIPVMNVVPPSWEICLIADDDPKHKGCFEVSEGTYNKYRIGYHYPQPM